MRALLSCSHELRLAGVLTAVRPLVRSFAAPVSTPRMFSVGSKSNLSDGKLSSDEEEARIPRHRADASLGEKQLEALPLSTGLSIARGVVDGLTGAVTPLLPQVEAKAGVWYAAQQLAAAEGGEAEGLPKLSVRLDFLVFAATELRTSISKAADTPLASPPRLHDADNAQQPARSTRCASCNHTALLTHSRTTVIPHLLTQTQSSHDSSHSLFALTLTRFTLSSHALSSRSHSSHSLFTVTFFTLSLAIRTLHIRSALSLIQQSNPLLSLTLHIYTHSSLSPFTLTLFTLTPYPHSSPLHTAYTHC